MAQCFIHPIDTVKTRLQVCLQDNQSQPLVACCAAWHADCIWHSTEMFPLMGIQGL